MRDEYAKEIMKCLREISDANGKLVDEVALLNIQIQKIRTNGLATSRMIGPG